MAIQLSGSLEMLGNIIASGGFTGSFSGSATSASFASTLQGLGSASFAPAGTFNTVSQSFATTSGSLSTRVTNLESTSSTVSSSFAITSGSISSRVTLIEGQYATTGSNNFTKPQQISDVSNAISFTSTASLYTDGGLRVKGSSFVSGTAYFNDVVVYGTSSIEYITSSQLAIGTNIITLNTDTPSIRFGGISVFDSGSNNLSTGSLFWDSEKDKWIYSNPSASTYDGGMLISGPRNSSGLGNEVGTTSCALMMGQGGDHITSSAIFSYGNATCFYGQSYISSSGLACFSGTVCSNRVSTTDGTNVSTLENNFLRSTAGNFYFDACAVGASFNFRTSNAGALDSTALFICGTNSRVGIGTTNPSRTFQVNGYISSFDGTTNTEIINSGGVGYFGTSTNHPLVVQTNNIERLRIASTGIACFACQVCANSTGGISGTFRSSTFFGSIDLENTGGDVAGKWNVQSVSGAQIGGSAGSSFGIYSYGASAYRLFINSSGNVGIGTTSPSTTLDILGAAGGPTTYGIITIANSSSRGISFGACSTNYTWIQGNVYGVGTANLVLQANGSNVGIGASINPQNLLEVSSTGGSPRIRVGTLQNNDNTPRFEAITSNGVSVANSAWLKVNDAGGFTLGQSDYTKTGGDSGNFANLSSEVEYPRIFVSSAGNVGIGTTSTSTEANLFLGAQGSTEGGQMVLQKATSFQCATHIDNYSNCFRIISGTDVGSTTVNMSINHINGAATFNGYVTAFGYQSIKGTITLASGATGTIYNVGTGTGQDGLYYVAARVGGGSQIYFATGIVSAMASAPSQLFLTSLYDGANVTLSVNGSNIRITNDGFATLTWSYSIIFQPVD